MRARAGARARARARAGLALCMVMVMAMVMCVSAKRARASASASARSRRSGRASAADVAADTAASRHGKRKGKGAVTAMGGRKGELRWIEGRITMPDGSRTPTTTVLLNGGQARAFTKVDGTFTFTGLAPGVYTLDVLSHAQRFLYGQFKVDVRKKSRTRALKYAYPGAAKETTTYPLDIRPLGVSPYFEPRQTVGMGTLLKNPMVLMMGFTGLMVFVLPKMMAGVDPEELKRYQEQNGGEDPMEELKKMWGGGGGNDSDDD